MGIPMPNIHVPTTEVSSHASDKELDDLPLPELIRRKDRLEGELSDLGSVLDSHGVRMTSSLTTFDGYPRADIDVAQVRTTRTRIIHLRNDHKALMARIERGLHAHFAAQQAAASDTDDANPISAVSTTSTSASSAQSIAVGPADPSSDMSVSSPQIGPPFAIVNSVSSDSPASMAGLRVGDKIQKFGEANWLNHEKLGLVARVVGRSEGQPVEVIVSRRSDVPSDEQRINLTLVPRSGWGGRGLLGCHLLPL